MADPYEVLGISVNVDDNAIRQRYLELIRTFTPEQQPARFAVIRKAYEQIKTLENRAQYRLFNAGKDDTIDAIIEDLSCQPSRPRPTFEQLLNLSIRG